MINSDMNTIYFLDILDYLQLYGSVKNEISTIANPLHTSPFLHTKK